MPDSASVSQEELALLGDQHFLLTKRRIDAKVTQLLLDSQFALARFTKNKRIPMPEEISLNSKKISKGENYESLPYWVSDFPAIMQKNDIWAFRSVVWWGHEISFSLMLKGKYKPTLEQLVFPLSLPNLFYSTHSDLWKLELTDDFALPFQYEHQETIREHYEGSDFIKLTLKSELTEINQLPALSVNSFDKLIGVLNSLA